MKALSFAVMALLLLIPLSPALVGRVSSSDYAEHCVAVMRPTEDLYDTYNWDTYPESPPTEWDKVDDTIRDDDATYVYTWGNEFNWVAQQFNMTDVAIVNQTLYVVDVWAVAKRLGTSSLPHIHLALYPQKPDPTTGISPGFQLTTNWVNYSYRFWYTPHSDAMERALFDAYYLNNTRLFLWGYNCSYPVAGILVSQVGIAVYQVIEENYEGIVPTTPVEWEINVINLFGLAGLIGMVATPTAAVWMLRRDGGSKTIALISALVAFMFCFTMFMVSLD